MNSLELAVEADREAVELVAEVLRAYGQGAVIDEPFLQPSLEDAPVPDPSRLPVVKTYIADDDRAQALCRSVEEDLWHIGQLRKVGSLQVRAVAQEDWANAWKAYFPVQRVGSRTVIVPTWRHHRRKPGEIVVRLDPGLAFGTGSHPTTRLCLNAAESLVQSGQHVLDVGTGSGILAIAAARLGADLVVGVDLDPVAVAAARANVRLNRLSRIVRIVEGSVDAVLDRRGDAPGRRKTKAGPRREFDVVLANLTARVNAALAPSLKAALSPEGRLVASGILAENLDIVREAFGAARLQILALAQEGDWVAVTAVHLAHGGGSL